MLTNICYLVYETQWDVFSKACNVHCTYNYEALG